MPYETVANRLYYDMNFTPLPKTWYHKEVDLNLTRTYQIAKRSDHTGVLIKLDMIDFFYLWS